MSVRYCGCDFSEDEIEQINRLIAEDKTRGRTELSRLCCQRFEWFKADGGLKDMSCRVAMLRMQTDELITLPALLRQPPPKKKIVFTQRTDAEDEITQPVHDLAPPQICPVTSPDHSRLWNEYIQRYHYLGHKTLPGAQIRYFVTIDQQIVAALGFAAAA